MHIYNLQTISGRIHRELLKSGYFWRGDLGACGLKDKGGSETYFSLFFLFLFFNHVSYYLIT